MRNLEKAAAVEVIVAGWGGGGLCTRQAFWVCRSGDPMALGGKER